MAWIQADLDALETAILKSKREVQFHDRRIIYHTLREMLDLRDAMKAELIAASRAATPRKRTFRAYQSGKGY